MADRASNATGRSTRDDRPVLFMTAGGGAAAPPHFPARTVAHRGELASGCFHVKFQSKHRSLISNAAPCRGQVTQSNSQRVSLPGARIIVNEIWRP